jgi:hypothetical protein
MMMMMVMMMMMMMMRCRRSVYKNRKWLDPELSRVKVGR